VTYAFPPGYRENAEEEEEEEEEEAEDIRYIRKRKVDRIGDFVKR
jgi:hypothetical protein